jgi:exopolysaccharide biosynthesis WecB/TagA/CpsF family protein
MKLSKRNEIKFFQKIDEILNEINIISFKNIDGLVRDIFKSQGSIVISFLNFQAINLSRVNNEFFHALAESDYLLRDGVAIEKFYALLGLNPGSNLNGTDFIPLLLLEAIKQNKRIILWGTSYVNLELARGEIEAKGGIVEDICDGFQTTETYISKIADISDDALIILGMGMPKQEILAVKLKAHGNRIIVNGGAFIDFTSGNISRAPQLIVRYKCEWLFRLIKEPKRLFKRTIVGGVWFMLYATTYIIRQRV